MIGEFNLGDLKIADFYFGTVKDVVQLSARRPAGVGGLSIAVGIFQPGGRQKQLQFPSPATMTGFFSLFIMVCRSCS